MSWPSVAQPPHVFRNHPKPYMKTFTVWKIAVFLLFFYPSDFPNIFHFKPFVFFYFGNLKYKTAQLQKWQTIIPVIFSLPLPPSLSLSPLLWSSIHPHSHLLRFFLIFYSLLCMSCFYTSFSLSLPLPPFCLFTVSLFSSFNLLSPFISSLPSTYFYYICTFFSFILLFLSLSLSISIMSV